MANEIISYLEACQREGGSLQKGMNYRTGNTYDELHFDHVIPFSKGGMSTTAENVQMLCARHNLEKRDKIM